MCEIYRLSGLDRVTCHSLEHRGMQARVIFPDISVIWWDAWALLDGVMDIQECGIGMNEGGWCTGVPHDPTPLDSQADRNVKSKNYDDTIGQSG